MASQMYGRYRQWPALPRHVFWGVIMPRLKSLGWETTKGKGLEVDERVYKPGWKAKWRDARRGEEYFLTYDEVGGHPDEKLITFVIENGILTREEIWPSKRPSRAELLADCTAKETPNPTERQISSIDSAGSMQLPIELTDNTSQRPSLDQKRKLEMEWGPRNQGSALQRPAKLQKTEHRQQPAYSLGGHSLLAPLEEKAAASELVKIEANTNHEKRPQPSDYGLKLLHLADRYLLDLVTIVIRSWGVLKNVHQGVVLDRSRIARLLMDIRASNQDLSHKISRLAVLVRSNVEFSAPRNELELDVRRFQSGGVVELLTNIKFHMQRLVLTIHRHCRSIRTPTEATMFQEETDASRESTRLEKLRKATRNIAKLQDDLRYEVREIAAERDTQEFLPHVPTQSVSEELTDSQRTITDNES